MNRAVSAAVVPQQTSTGQHYLTRAGVHVPPGAVCDATGVNFSIFARNATQAELRLYEHADSPEPFQVIQLSPGIHRTFLFWHVYVEQLPAGGVRQPAAVAEDDDVRALGVHLRMVRKGMEVERLVSVLQVFQRRFVHGFIQITGGRSCQARDRFRMAIPLVDKDDPADAGPGERN